jgi:carboxymethylenebutenolidase
MRPDGSYAPGYLLVPEVSEDAPGVVLVEEWWGVNDQIKQVGHTLASAGYRVLIPDFFRGNVTAEYNEASHQMEGLDFADATTQDVRGAIMHLRGNGAKVAVVGFCMGGAIAILAALHVAELDAAVSFYGAPPPEGGDPASIQIPTLAHWAKNDEFFARQIDAIERSLHDSVAPFKRFWYDAPHGFCNPNQPGQGGLGHYDEQAAELAWRRTFEFLEETLR